MPPQKPVKKKQVKTKPQKKIPNKNSDYLQYFPYLILAILIILVIIIRNNFIGIAFERDEGTYCYYGQLILDGKVPFLDFSEMKFPGIYYAYALVMAIFGTTLEQIQTGFIVINLINIILLFFIGRALFSDIVALIIAASFAILSVSPYTSGFTVQAEHLVLLFANGGLLLLIYAIKNNKAWQFFLSGFILCFSFLIKQSGIFFIIIGGIAILGYYWMKKDERTIKGIKNAIFFSAGVLIPIAIMLILMYSYGALDEMYYWVFVRSRYYISKNSISHGMELLSSTFAKIIANYYIFWISGFIGLVVIFFLDVSKYIKAMLLIGAVLSFLTIVPGFRFLYHYWIQLLPALSIFIGVTFMFLIQLLNKITNKNVSGIIVLFAFIILVITHLNNNNRYYFKTDHLRVMRDVYMANPFPEAKVIGDFIKDHTDEEDKIAILGSEFEVFIYSGRRGVSEFQYYFSTLMSDTIIFPESKDRQMELIEDIKKEKPKYMLVFRHRNSIWASPNASYMIFTLFDQITAKDYNLICYADMISDYNTQYIWYENLNGYEPKGSYSILLFERKDETPGSP